MRSADRLIRRVCARRGVRRCWPRARCSATSRQRPATGAPTEAKAAPATATGKEAAAAAAKPDAADQPRRAARLRRRAPGAGRGAHGRRRRGYVALTQVRSGARRTAREPGTDLSPGRQAARGGGRSSNARSSSIRSGPPAQPARHHLPHGRGSSRRRAPHTNSRYRSTRTTPPPSSTSAFCTTCISAMAHARSNFTTATWADAGRRRPGEAGSAT